MAKPDYEIRAMKKGGEMEERGKIGVGWTQADGSIQIRFDYFVRVPTGPEFAIQMFRQDKDTPAASVAQLPLSGRDYDPDDVPF